MFLHCYRRVFRLACFPALRPAKQRYFAQSTSPPAWSDSTLEDRLLLAADVATCASVPAETSGVLPSPELVVAEPDRPTDPHHAEHGEAVAIVFVDSEVADSEVLTKGVSPGADVYLIPANSDGISFISRILEQKQNVQSIQLISHGRSGAVSLAGAEIDLAFLERRAAEISRWSNSLSATADILLLGCDVGHGTAGGKFVDSLAKLSGCDVSASTNRTGNTSLRGDWQLERAVGVVDMPIALSGSAREQYASCLQITIRAAGSTGEESMQLQIDGVTVQSWSNVAGDDEARDFQSFTYNTSQSISADRVRVVFTNDRFLPGLPDRNLRIDSINIDGIIYEAESPTVFSTGTWKEADGIVPGFRESEYLHANGYMQPMTASRLERLTAIYMSIASRSTASPTKPNPQPSFRRDLTSRATALCLGSEKAKHCIPTASSNTRRLPSDPVRSFRSSPRAQRAPRIWSCASTTKWFKLGVVSVAMRTPKFIKPITTELWVRLRQIKSKSRLQMMASKMGLTVT